MRTAVSSSPHLNTVVPAEAGRYDGSAHSTCEQCLLMLGRPGVPPVHMFLQLRGSCALGRSAALWRTAALLATAGLVVVLYLIVILILSVK